MLEIGGQLSRVQVKWGRLSQARDVVIVPVGMCRCTPRGYVRRTYTEHEVDLFAVYCGELDRCFLLPAPMLAHKTYVSLRLTAPCSGQRSCINLADDFTFDGAVAQLARARDWQSRGRGFESPQLHPNPEEAPATVSAEVCRVSFGHWIDRVARGEKVVVTRRGKPIVRMTSAAPASPPPSVMTAAGPALPPTTAVESA